MQNLFFSFCFVNVNSKGFFSCGIDKSEAHVQLSQASEAEIDGKIKRVKHL